MVFVAKSFDAPAKIIFPLSFDPWKQGILGLGDIVVPGIFISLNMRSPSYWVIDLMILSSAGSIIIRIK